MATIPFLGFPPEIRNRIYFFIIPQGKIYDLESNESHAASSRRRHYANEPVPAVCQTSKQLRCESMPIWRSSNSFTVFQTASVANGPPVQYNPSIEQILLLHLDGGFEHTRCLRWSVIGDQVPVAGGASAMVVEQVGECVRNSQSLVMITLFSQPNDAFCTPRSFVPTSIKYDWGSIQANQIFRQHIS
jgi:hypothetical protein